MNASPNLDREHIINVCETVVTHPSIPQADSDEITLAFIYEHQRDRAAHALRSSGYDAEIAQLRDAHPYGIRVTGWSPDGLERRAARLRSAAARYGTDARLNDTVGHAIETASQKPIDADPVSASYEVATEVTEHLTGRIRHDVGLLTPPARLPADPQYAYHIQAVQCLANKVSSVLGDHFNVACIAAGTYIHTRREHAGAQPGGQPDRQADHAAEMAAVSKAWHEARDFIADPVDPDAFLEAAEWAHRAHSEDAGAFALDYGREHRGVDPDERPRPKQAYLAWRDAQAAETSPESPTQIAAADFPHPPGTAPDTTATAGTGPAQDPTIPRQGRAPGRP